MPPIDDLHPSYNDPTQQRYELIRPLLLVPECTAMERAAQTDTHPETLGALKRRFEQQGMRGLLPASLEVLPAGRQRRVPEDVVHELQRLKGLYDGFGYRELARILFHTLAHRPNPAMTSFTPVHHEADWVLPGPTRAWQRPFFPLR